MVESCWKTMPGATDLSTCTNPGHRRSLQPVLPKLSACKREQKNELEDRSYGSKEFINVKEFNSLQSKR